MDGDAADAIGSAGRMIRLMPRLVRLQNASSDICLKGEKYENCISG